MLQGYRQLSSLHKNINVAKDVGERFHTSNYELDRPCLKAIKKMKDELGGKINLHH